MIYGFENEKFYMDYPSCTRKPGNMKEESEHRAREIAAVSDKILISLSSGIDSQSVLHSFCTQGIPVECAFLYLPGYNDNEYTNVDIVKKKYGVKVHIVDMDPIKVQEECEQESLLTGIHPNSINQKMFLAQLPDDWDFIQITHDPYVHIHNDGRWSFFTGYNTPEVMRDLAFKSLNRKGKYFFFGDTSEFTYSYLADDIYRSVLYAVKYFDGNGLNKPNTLLKTVDRWDYYIKPILYGKYWRDELIYFPKDAGFHRISYLKKPLEYRKHGILIPYFEFLDHLGAIDGTTKRYYSNIDSQ